MSVTAAVENGEIVDTSASSLSSTSTTTADNSSLDKEAFLQLLVAQMKYQDPLEPTSNTEYISQLATFSQLEELQNLESSYQINRASELVGQPVVLQTTDSTSGETYYSAGYVDAIIIESDEPYLYVNGSYYSIDDLDTVLDPDYYDEYLESQGLTDSDDDTETDTDDASTDSST